MSGLAGCWRAGAPADHDGEDALRVRLEGLLAGLHHRGRQRAGWVDAARSVAIGRCHGASGSRTAAGGISQHERFVLAFSGSLRDRAGLQRELLRAGVPITSDESDEWLMLKGVARWGLQRMLARSEGAFALALWDRHALRLTLAIDRFGQQPLYYGRCGHDLVFASEMKALRRHPEFEDRIDVGALAHLLRLDYIPAPGSIHAGISKLGPGQWISLDARTWQAGPPPLPTATAYWRADTLMSEAIAAREPERPMDDLLDLLQSSLTDAIGRMQPAPRPTLLLSGGVDSSLLGALMQARQEEPLDAITIAFDSERHDEAQWASGVAGHLRLRHHALRMDGRLAAELVPALPQVWCEPFADASQLPTLLATRMAATWSRHLYTGDGADELFFGHGAYVRALRNWRLSERVPPAMRGWLQRLAPELAETARLGGWAALHEALLAADLDTAWLQRISRWRAPARVLRGAQEPPLPQLSLLREPDNGFDEADRLALLDLSLDLPFGVLTKLERAAASRGIRVDCPFLDLQVARLGWALPLSLKYRDGQQKYVLKQLLARHLPAELVWRPKRGFGPPIADWMANPLRDWAEALLDPVRLRDQGLFDVSLIERLWREFLRGQRKWHTHLWSVLMFQAWYAHWQENGPARDGSLN